MTMRGIAAIGTYLPRLRLSRAAIADALGWLLPGISPNGCRSLAYWDENSTTMAVEAARRALTQVSADVSRLALATGSPVFAEPQNAATVHRALRLARSAPAVDVSGAGRGCLSILIQLLEGRGDALVVGSDRHVGPAGSEAETRMGDGAAAAVVGDGDLVFEFLAGSDATSAFVDRYRADGMQPRVGWEERWVREEGYLKQIPPVIGEALRRAAVDPAEVRHLVMPSTIPGTGQAVARARGLVNAAVAGTLSLEVGDIGAGHCLLMLAHAASGMEAGEIVVLCQFGQGAGAVVLRRTARAIGGPCGGSAVLSGGIVETNYLKLPILGGMLEWDRGLRGRSAPGEALTAFHRNEDALLGFVGARSVSDGTVQFPGTGTAGTEPWPLADRGGTLATITADRLAFSPHPPSCYGLVDFDGGGRLMMDVTDPDAAGLGVGDPVSFVFRVRDRDPATGYVRYFWKAVGAGRGRAQAPVRGS